MFTTLPSLAQRFERLIGETPVIDPGSRVRVESPGVTDLAALLDEPGLRADLIAAGMPRDDASASVTVEERVRKAWPYLRRAWNTPHAWCFRRILRDLYDVYEPEPAEAALSEIAERVASKASDPEWPGQVLRERARIAAVFAPWEHPAPPAAVNPTGFHHRLEPRGLLGAIPTERREAPGNADVFDGLVAWLGSTPATTEKLTTAIQERLEGALTGGACFTTLTLPPGQRLIAADEAYTQYVLNQANEEWDLSDSDIDSLLRFVAWQVLAWHHQHRRTVRIELREPASRTCERPWIDAPTHAQDLARALRQFPRARIDVTSGTPAFAEQAVALAREFPNVWVSDGVGPVFGPANVERRLELHLDGLPINRVVGFVSSATTVEWVYGKLQLFRKAVANHLARRVEAGFTEEDDVPPLLRQILHDTPRALYGLSSESPRD